MFILSREWHTQPFTIIFTMTERGREREDKYFEEIWLLKYGMFFNYEY